jgi:hypothetical protein
LTNHFLIVLLFWLLLNIITLTIRNYCNITISGPSEIGITSRLLVWKLQVRTLLPAPTHSLGGKENNSEFSITILQLSIPALVIQV